MQPNLTFAHALLWGIVTAVAMTMLEAFASFDPEKILDWRLFLIALGGSAIRSGAQAGLQAFLTWKRSS